MKNDPVDRQQRGCCPETPGDSSCDCRAPREGSRQADGGPAEGRRGGARARTIAFSLIMIAAVSVAGRSLMTRTDSGQSPAPGVGGCGGAVAACDPDAASCGAGVSCSPSALRVDLASSASLSDAVAGTDAAFVLLPGEDEAANAALSGRVDAAVVRLTDSGKNVAAVTLESGTESFESLVSATGIESFPSVVVVGSLGQLALAEGEGRTDELLRAFVAATIQSAAGAVPCGTSCGK